jgi:hypothetical protein
MFCVIILGASESIIVKELHQTDAAPNAAPGPNPLACMGKNVKLPVPICNAACSSKIKRSRLNNSGNNNLFIAFKSSTVTCY